MSLFLEEGSSPGLCRNAVGAVKLFSFSFLVVGYNVVTAGYYAATERPTQSLIISVGRGLVLLAASLFPMAYFFGSTGSGSRRWYRKAPACCWYLRLAGSAAEEKI